MTQRYGEKKLKIFQAKNLLVFILVAYAFYFLYSYRFNDPITAGRDAPDFQLETLDGQNFDFGEIRTPKILIFFADGEVYTPHYMEIIPELKVLSEKYSLELVVITEYGDNIKKVRNLLHQDKYKILENITYLANIDDVADLYGVNSLPHFYMMNASGVVIAQSKLPSARKISRMLRSF